MSEAGGETGPDIEEYRLRARAWLAANMEPRAPGRRGRRLRGVDHKTVEGIAGERDRQRRLYQAGYAGITWPVAVGGRGLSDAYERAFNEEAAGYAMPDFGVAGGTTMMVCAPTMLAHASEAFNRRHIPAILSGDEIWVQFFSEPGAGSDLAGVTTRAGRDGDRWVLNGSKIWSSGAYYADYGMCLARTNWDVPKHRGLTWFAVATTAPGVTVQPIREINGDAEFCQEFFDDVLLSDDDVIGGVDHGWTVARSMLVFERGAGRPDTEPAPSGPRELAPDLVALARAVHRQADPTVRQLIGRAHTNDFIEAELNRWVGARLRHGEPMASSVAAYGKLAAGTFGPVRARIGMEIGRAATVAWPAGDVEPMTAAVNYLNSRVQSIAGGSNEMQRNAIAEGVLGLPREPAVDLDQPFGEVVRRARRPSGPA